MYQKIDTIYRTMPHVSKESIENELYEKLFLELQKVIIESNKKSVNIFLLSVLTETERIMLTKRFATVVFLSQGLSNYEIWKLLKLSPSTVARTKLAYEEGRYDQLLKLSKKQTGNKFINLLEVMLRGGLPPRTAERWKYVSGL
jgi:DNA-binding CsgD family transcriptional regulator